MATVTIEGVEYESLHLPTENTCILLVRSPGGFVGCGYFDVNVANRVGDAVAIVSGVNSIEELLNKPVVRLSEKAREAGVAEGMPGSEALRLLAGAPPRVRE